MPPLPSWTGLALTAGADDARTGSASAASAATALHACPSADAAAEPLTARANKAPPNDDSPAEPRACNDHADPAEIVYMRAGVATRVWRVAAASVAAVATVAASPVVSPVRPALI
jgi:hypothetical protein